MVACRSWLGQLPSLMTVAALRTSCRDEDGPDPQSGTLADTYTWDDYVAAMRELMLDSSLTAAREG